jgi:amidase
MDRSTFFKSLATGAAVSLASSGKASAAQPQGSASRGKQTRKLASGVLTGSQPETSGVRLLGKEKDFTLWTPDIKAGYTVKQGEIVLLELGHGMPGLVTRDGTFRKAGPGAKINPQTGPVYVEGVKAGDGIAIDLLEIHVGDWGYSGGKVYEFSDGYVQFSDELRLPLLPMLGCLGVAPAQGSLDTKAPGETGGNMDCKEVRAGSTVAFTAGVDGAMVGMGDTHALQGDGEIRGQGLECDSMVLARFRALPEPLSPRPVILRPEFVATVGAMVDMNEACWQATDDMTNLLVAVTGRDKKEARALVNLVGDLKVNQIVDPVKGARMEVPSWVFGV